MLTAVQVRSSMAREHPCKLAESGGFYLLVQPNGSKPWRYKFRIDGVEGKQVLGALPELSLAEARGLHSDSRELVAQDINPVQVKQEPKVVQTKEQLQRAKGKFAAVVADWNALSATGLRPSTIRQRQREIENDLVPELKSRAMDT